MSIVSEERSGKENLFKPLISSISISTLIVENLFLGSI